MALGTPVISTDCPTGPRDLLEDGDAGLLVPLEDVDAMSDVLERVSTDTTLRARLIRRASEKIAGFDVPAANRRIAALAGGLLAAPR